MELNRKANISGDPTQYELHEFYDPLDINKKF